MPNLYYVSKPNHLWDIWGQSWQVSTTKSPKYGRCFCSFDCCHSYPQTRNKNCSLDAYNKWPQQVERQTATADKMHSNPSQCAEPITPFLSFFSFSFSSFLTMSIPTEKGIFFIIIFSGQYRPIKDFFFFFFFPFCSFSFDINADR